MLRSVTRKMVWSAVATFPVVLFAFSTGPPAQRTGAPVDGGLNCTACHRTFAPANSDPRGSVTVAAAAYSPGVTQTIKVTIQHPLQKRWGFQLTARLASDPSKQAGTFAVNSLVRVRCANCSDAPCNGGTEFPEHNNAQFTDVGAGFTYTVDWTPPSTNVGDVIFYAAGNAANGDGTFNGDYIYTTSAIVSPASCALTGLPGISAVGNGASFQTTISPGALVTLFGSGFQPSGLTRSVFPADIVNSVYPSKLSCVAVEIDGKRAPLIYLQGNQINAQAPMNVSQGMVAVRVLLNPDTPAQITSSTIMVASNAYSAGLFTLDGKNAAATTAAGQVLGAGGTAKAGDMITLYATGLGDTQPHIDAGAVAGAVQNLVQKPTVTIGGIQVSASDVTFAGVSPGTISCLDQINVRVPPSAPNGNLAVKISIGSASSPDGVTIPISQ